jgi:hypothetical protein
MPYKGTLMKMKAWFEGDCYKGPHSHKKDKGCVSCTMALPFTLNGILRQNKNYENSNISPCRKIIFKKILQKKPKSFKILL